MRLISIAGLCVAVVLIAQSTSKAETCRAPNCRPQAPAPKPQPPKPQPPKPQPPKPQPPQPPIPAPPKPGPKACDSSSYKCPDTCEKVEVLCERSGENLCGGFCVFKKPDMPGRCLLVIPNTSEIHRSIVGQPEKPGVLRCGQVLTPQTYKKIIENMRSDLGAILRKLRNGGAPTDPGDREMLSGLFLRLISEQCVAMDEWYHMIDPYQCCHHKACAERGSGEAYRQCLEHSEELVRLLTNIFPELKKKVLADFCRSASYTASAVAVETCVCDQSRIVPPGVNSANCKACAETLCALNPKKWPSRGSICAVEGILGAAREDIRRACLEQYASGNPGNPISHSCVAYAGRSDTPKPVYLPLSSMFNTVPDSKSANQSSAFDSSGP
jgi:hypothetical protein